MTPRAAWNPMVVMNPHYDGQKTLIQPGASFKTPAVPPPPSLSPLLSLALPPAENP